MFPQIFGKYILERPIATGGMARVFLATLRGAGGFEKKLVVKQIRAELATDDAFVRRFVDEAKTTVELSHPNIVPVYELGVEQGIYFLAMELCDGVTLAELIQKTGALSPDEGSYVGIEICRALDYAHRKARIIHRDVTPRNVIIDEEGAVRLIDFGIAAPAFTGAKEIFGSPGHMPPEQIEGGELGPYTDVFAVATLLYETWSTKAPFRRSTSEASEKTLALPVLPLASFDATLASLDDLLGAALSLDPSKRPQSAEEFSRPLRRFIADRDLGDLARSVGERVARLRTAGEAPRAEGADTAPQATPVVNVTRTFAARHPSERPPSGSPSQRPPELDLSTRKMTDDQGSWSTGRQRAASVKHRGGKGIVGAAVGSGALIAAAALFWKGRPEEPKLASAAPTATSGLEASVAVAGEAEAKTAIDAAIAPPGASAASTGEAPRAEAGAAVGDAPGHLKILANPRSSVRIDGRERGSSPISDLAISPGNHFVSLDCAPLGESVGQNVHVKSGETLTISGDFTGAKGRILVRR
ncbi:MAG TPA: protein kinase [Polyangiaceae bacterium]|nr:protein kinase [Polyangiaceae bacterium]